METGATCNWPWGSWRNRSATGGGSLGLQGKCAVSKKRGPAPRASRQGPRLAPVQGQLVATRRDVARWSSREPSSTHRGWPLLNCGSTTYGYKAEPFILKFFKMCMFINTFWNSHQTAILSLGGTCHCISEHCQFNCGFESYQAQNDSLPQQLFRTVLAVA